MEGKKLTKKSNLWDVLIDGRIFIVLLLLIVIMAAATTKFLMLANIRNVLRQISINAIIAIGMSFVITTGNIDLSVGSIVGLSSIVVGKLAMANMPLPLVITIGVVAGGIAGALNGLIIAHFKIPAFVATLAMQNAVRGAAYLLCEGLPIAGFSSSYNVIGQGYWLGVPIPVYIMFLVAIIAWFVFARTRFGRHVYFTGGNEMAARNSGINVFGVKVSVYTISGILAGLAAVILTFRIASALPENGTGYEGDAIAATVIGGTAMRGGYSTVYGTLVGALILGIIENGMNLLGVSEYWQMIIKGLVILLAVIMDNEVSRIRMEKVKK